MSEKKDHILKTISELLVEPGMSAPVTLLIRGLILSGSLIPKQSIKEMITTIPGYEDVFDDLQGRTDIVAEPLADDEESDYIYLRPVSIIHGPSNVGLNFPGPMRIKLSSVDGFAMGMLANSEANKVQ